MAYEIKRLLACLGFLTVGIGLAVCFRRAHWKSRTLKLLEMLSCSTPAQEAKRVTFDDFDQLPEPVARYLRLTLKEGQPLIRSVRIVQQGQLRGLEQSKSRWMPFKAVQFFSTLRPGYIWDAQIRAAALIKMQVRDAYVAGHGMAQVSLLSLLTLADEQGKAELDSGALMRYLAEAVWFPTALLPTPSLTWTPINANKARATLTDASTTVSLEFEFNAAGEVSGFSTAGRYRAVGTHYELTPWSGSLRCYEERDGMWIPTAGEVKWHVHGGAFCVWQGEIINIQYGYAE